MNDDTISRKAAIAIANAYRHDIVAREIGELIAELPSAQPEIIRCKDCKNWQIDWESANAPEEHFCAMVDGFHYGDWYCADASRRSGAEMGGQDETN